MDTPVIIKAEHLTKEYIIFTKNSRRLLSALFGIGSGPKRTAIDDISFEIHKGEKVAILGQVGSGRSTLLKLISGIVFPTGGKLEVSEKVNAMFDLKAGFDAELTGRQNLYMKGNILGWSKKEIREFEDEIIEFSELKEYIDLPAKTYTAGMSAGLGFTIQTQMKPEIFVMDENFAVGNKQFKEKCIERLKGIVNQEDVTYVMVTRNFAFARQMCDRAIVLDKGRIVFDGAIGDGIKYYRKNIKKAGEKSIEEQMEDRAIELSLEDQEEYM